MADEKEVKEVVEENNDKDKSKKKSKNKKGIFSRIWSTVFRLRSDDFEKRLQYISKEEVTLLSRMKRRSLRWRRTARNLIIFSVILELVAVGFAIMTTRTVDMDWRTRSLRVLPMFLLPGLSFALYYGILSFTKFCDRRDQKALERLRDERQAKIDELKERTNYYMTQQLIQVQLEAAHDRFLYRFTSDRNLLQGALLKMAPNHFKSVFDLVTPPRYEKLVTWYKFVCEFMWDMP